MFLDIISVQVEICKLQQRLSIYEDSAKKG